VIRSSVLCGTTRKRRAYRRLQRHSWMVVPAVAAALSAVLLVEGGRYPPMVIAPFGVGIAGIAYSLRTIVNGQCRARATKSSAEAPEPAAHVLDEIREFKVLIAQALPGGEVSRWLVSPHPVLNGSTPVEVFFGHGLEATRTAISHSQEDNRIPK